MKARCVARNSHEVEIPIVSVGAGSDTQEVKGKNLMLF